MAHPFIPGPLIETPPQSRLADTSIALWRYMDLSKFIQMLDSQSLYFSRIDRFTDTFEGSYSEVDYNNVSSPGSPASWLEFANFTRNFLRYVSFASCWHASPHESAALWALYLKSNDGIAIRSTVSSLVSSFRNNSQKPIVGRVIYSDFRTEAVLSNGLLCPIFTKRLSFEHEKEVRAVLVHNKGLEMLSGIPPLNWNVDKDLIPFGMSSPVDLDLLINGVYVPPTAPTWFARIVNSVMSHYGLNKEVQSSELAIEPPAAKNTGLK